MINMNSNEALESEATDGGIIEILEDNFKEQNSTDNSIDLSRRAELVPVHREGYKRSTLMERKYRRMRNIYGIYETQAVVILNAVRKSDFSYVKNWSLSDLNLKCCDGIISKSRLERNQYLIVSPRPGLESNKYKNASSPQQKRKKLDSFTCLLCDMSMNTLSDLEKHTVSHGQFPANPKETLAKRHKRNEKSTKNKDGGNFSCLQCDFSFHVLSDLEKHTVSHDQLKASEQKKYRYQNIRKIEAYECVICLKFYRTVEETEEHIICEHIELHLKPLSGKSTPENYASSVKVDHVTSDVCRTSKFSQTPGNSVKTECSDYAYAIVNDEPDSSDKVKVDHITCAVRRTCNVSESPDGENSTKSDSDGVYEIVNEEPHSNDSVEVGGAISHSCGASGVSQIPERKNSEKPQCSNDVYKIEDNEPDSNERVEVDSLTSAVCEVSGVFQTQDGINSGEIKCSDDSCKIEDNEADIDHMTSGVYRTSGAPNASNAENSVEKCADDLIEKTPNVDAQQRSDTETAKGVSSSDMKWCESLLSSHIGDIHEKHLDIENNELKNINKEENDVTCPENDSVFKKICNETLHGVSVSEINSKRPGSTISSFDTSILDRRFVIEATEQTNKREHHCNLENDTKFLETENLKCVSGSHTSGFATYSVDDHDKRFVIEAAEQMKIEETADRDSKGNSLSDSSKETGDVVSRRSEKFKLPKLQKFKCVFCNKTYCNRFNMFRHIKSSHKETVCVICKHDFKTIEQFHNHVHAVHFVEMFNSSFTCLVCKFTANKNEQIKQHISQHHPHLELYCCSACRHCESSIQIMQLHVEKMCHKRDHSDHSQEETSRKWHCSACVFQAKDKVQLDAHWESEHISNKKLYSCSKCKKLFTNPQFLKLHMQEHECNHSNNHSQTASKAKSCICDICGQILSTLDALKGHKLRRHGSVESRVKCNICEKFYPSEEILKRHKIEHQLNIPCEVCGALVKDRARYNRHMKRVHCENENIKCAKCSKTFRSAYHVDRHMERVHSNPAYQCQECFKTFRLKKYLIRHVDSVHTTERKFKCDICQDQFKMKHHLKVHMLKHTGERAFKCKKCDKSFSRKQILETHMLTHTGEKAFVCEHCEKSFFRKTDLNKHMCLVQNANLKV